MKGLDPFDLPLEGTCLVEASAGTGKTYTITTLFLRLLVERRLLPSQILVVTYTNAATAELRNKVRRRLHEALSVLSGAAAPADETLAALLARRREAGALAGDALWLAEALRNFDEAGIFTIHGFCQRMLQENAFESGAAFDTEMISQQGHLLAEVVADFWANRLYEADELFVAFLHERGVCPDVLTRMASVLLSNPRIAVVPDVLDAADDELVAAWRRRCAGVAAMWHERREQIVARLEESTVLKKTSYPEGSVAGRYAVELDRLLAAATPSGLADSKAFARFTRSGVERGTRVRQPPPQDPFFDLCESILALAADLVRAFEVRLLGLQRELFEEVRREMRRRKEETHRQSFDDLLVRLAEALAAPSGVALAEGIRRRFPVALVDEFQDTDPIQYDVFRRVYHDAGAALFLIGDPKQAIYAFRGADVFTYMAARDDAAERRYTLDTNRRSDPSLVRAVNTVFGRAAAPFLFDRIPFSPVVAREGAADLFDAGEIGRAPLQFRFVRRDGRAGRDGDSIPKKWAWRNLPGAVAAEVARFVNGGATIDGRRVEPGEVAVLCRTNDQAERVQRALRALRVPTVLRGAASVFDTEEAVEVERLVCALAAPGDRRALRSALATSLIGLTANDLCALPGDEQGWDAWVERFRGWNGLWGRRGFMPAFRRVLDECDVRARLLGVAGGERRLTNVLHLAELLQQASVERRLGFVGLVQWLARLRVDEIARTELGEDAEQIRLESDARAVQLITIHKSKGLEFPVVFCPFLWEAAELRKDEEAWVRFHDPAHGDRLTLDIGSAARETHKRHAEAEVLAEGLRLLYVALTRARHCCVAVWGAFHGAPRSPLGYLLHGPERAAGSAVEGPRLDLAEKAAERIAGLDDEDMIAELRELARASGGAMSVSELVVDRGEEYAFYRDGADGPLAGREARRELNAGWRTSSFTALASGAPTEAEPGEGSDGEGRAVFPAGSEDPPTAESVRLSEFPAGADAGNLIHEVLEKADFRRSDPGELRRLIVEAGARYGVAEHWADVLGEALGDLFDTPLGDSPDAPRLGLLSESDRIAEMEFFYPVGIADERGGAALRLTRERLAAVFARHAADPLPASYAERIGRLEFAPLAGYLHGFIDLVFRHRDRWYVVDYKSNHLGPRRQDYAPTQLAAEMARDHYFLQYHIYAVALHRYLGLRLPGYEYERHFGGVYYLFVRGVAPGHPPGCGVFFDRPPPARIEALSEALRGAQGGAP